MTDGILITAMVAAASSRPVEQQIALLVDRRQFLKRRWRGVAADGNVFGFDLQERLVHGAVIHQTEDVDYVIFQEPELVYVLEPSNQAESALMGWKIGNLHMPVEIQSQRILALHDPAVLQLIQRENWAHAEESVLFNPLRVTAHAV